VSLHQLGVAHQPSLRPLRTRPTKLSPTSLKQSEQNQSLLMEPKALEKSARRVRACSTYPSRSHPAPGNGKTARESARQIPACSRLSQEPKARWRPGSADPTAPEQVWQTPGLRELRSECEQILPPAGNRKPASDQAHRIQPVQCSSRRRPCRGRERGDRQSSVPPDPTPSQAQPTGRRIAGYDYKTEAIQRPRADSYARSREMTKAVYVVSGNYQMRREYPPERHEGGRRSS